MIADTVEAAEHQRAAIAGVTIVARVPGLTRVETAHAAVKYRLHRGVYHHVTHVFIDHHLTTAQFLCVLLAASGLAHKDIGAKLAIGSAGIRDHLREAARKTRSASVAAMLAALRERARREIAARNSVGVTPPPEHDVTRSRFRG